MRLDHAILDSTSRQKKAAKIIRIIERRKCLSGATVLEIGTGSGVIAAAMAEEVGSSGSVWAIDVKDQRVLKDGYRFQQVGNTLLPFPDNEFDLVVSNHVIEHVGDESDQLQHLTEIRRVLKPHGLLYLAVPNKWRLIEPHYRIPLLSWLPKRLADGAVRATGKNREFDCRLLSRNELRSLLRHAGLASDEVDREALGLVADIEGSQVARLISRFPAWVFNVLLLIVPTFIVIARREKQ